jgi:hypothetical protein
VSTESLIAAIDSFGGLKIQVWQFDLDHAISGHPEVTLDQVRETLMHPKRVIQSLSSANACLFYSELKQRKGSEVLFFCVVVAILAPGAGKLVTAYETDFMKKGKCLFKRGD